MRVPSLALRVRWSQGTPPRSCDANGEPQAGLAKWSTQYGNLPQRYMLRKARKLNYITPVASQCFKNEILTGRIQDFPLERPWTDEYWREHEVHPNMIGSPAVYAQPIKEEDWMWFRGDRVEVLRGKDKGKQGYINYIVQEKNWVCVEGLNCKYETVGKTDDFPGMMYMSEEPLLVTTDIALVDPADEKATDVEWRYTEDGERVRISARSGRQLPIPSEAYETIDYKTPQGYAENKAKDTMAKDVEDITYRPKLATFEMELMELYGIKEMRQSKPTFFY